MPWLQASALGLLLRLLRADERAISLITSSEYLK